MKNAHIVASGVSYGLGINFIGGTTAEKIGMLLLGLAIVILVLGERT